MQVELEEEGNRNLRGPDRHRNLLLHLEGTSSHLRPPEDSQVEEGNRAEVGNQVEGSLGVLERDSLVGLVRGSLEGLEMDKQGDILAFVTEDSLEGTADLVQIAHLEDVQE